MQFAPVPDMFPNIIDSWSLDDAMQPVVPAMWDLNTKTLTIKNNANLQLRQNDEYVDIIDFQGAMSAAILSEVPITLLLQRKDKSVKVIGKASSMEITKDDIKIKMTTSGMSATGRTAIISLAGLDKLKSGKYDMIGIGGPKGAYYPLELSDVVIKKSKKAGMAKMEFKTKDRVLTYDQFTKALGSVSAIDYFEILNKEMRAVLLKTVLPAHPFFIELHGLHFRGNNKWQADVMLPIAQWKSLTNVKRYEQAFVQNIGNCKFGSVYDNSTGTCLPCAEISNQISILKSLDTGGDRVRKAVKEGKLLRLRELYRKNCNRVGRN